MSQGFYDVKESDLTFVPFDIETTGFKAADGDFVTNVVLHHEDNYHIFINTNGDKVDASEMQKKILKETELENIVLYACETERKLLLNISDYLESHTDDNTILTAFNGETYRANTDFDVPFLRTRCLRNGVGWILDGFWYSDTYEVFSQSSRFDTTVKDSPTLEGMKKVDLKQFVNDMSYNISCDNMNKAEIVNSIEKHKGVSSDALERWADDNITNQEERNKVDCEDPSSFKKAQLQDFIDTNSIDIPYDSLSKDEIIREIRERDFSQKQLIDWHEHTGLSIGTKEATTLDDIHEVLLEDMTEDEEWRRNLPFDVEVFEPFDPFDDSGEAVTAYMNGNYTGVILHCFADVARTVNITRLMKQYAPKKDYRPKVL